MNPLSQSKNTTILPVLIALTLGCLGLSPQARAVDPPPDGGYLYQNTAEGEDALFSLTTRADNTAMGFDALDSNTTGCDNTLASWIWRRAGRLNTARDFHTATLLQNGMVLVAGGINHNISASASAELYDPASGTWTATGSLNTARVCITRRRCYKTASSLLQGELDSNFSVSASAELYDPASGTWTATGSLNTARVVHTATLLQNGMVLVAGGFDSNGYPSASAELYDPASGTWTATGSLNTARAHHTATLLQNGMVLVAGGLDSNFMLPRAPNCTTRRAGLGLPRAASTPHVIYHTATLLQNGMVLVAGGTGTYHSGQRGTVRPGERDLDCHGQPQHRTL